jgi:hypothetical protein
MSTRPSPGQNTVACAPGLSDRTKQKVNVLATAGIYARRRGACRSVAGKGYLFGIYPSGWCDMEEAKKQREAPCR